MTYFYCTGRKVSLNQRFPVSIYVGLAVVRAQYPCFGSGRVGIGTVTTVYMYVTVTIELKPVEMSLLVCLYIKRATRVSLERNKQQKFQSSSCGEIPYICAWKESSPQYNQ